MEFIEIAGQRYPIPGHIAVDAAARERFAANRAAGRPLGPDEQLEPPQAPEPAPDPLAPEN